MSKIRKCIPQDTTSIELSIVIQEVVDEFGIQKSIGTNCETILLNQKLNDRWEWPLGCKGKLTVRINHIRTQHDQVDKYDSKNYLSVRMRRMMKKW